ncbi:hypothetical protein DY000_02044452 [Brassica cretica]|uniref:Uncharacterized protein n=1 Tax=Brassica cretica TaxID=69181 RepID=A0ABQ7EXK6_BRACR|nr:hypothetical protein DY000_02044452 [Brassica cretica]
MRLEMDPNGGVWSPLGLRCNWDAQNSIIMVLLKWMQLENDAVKRAGVLAILHVGGVDRSIPN